MTSGQSGEVSAESAGSLLYPDGFASRGPTRGAGPRAFLRSLDAMARTLGLRSKFASPGATGVDLVDEVAAEVSFGVTHDNEPRRS